MRVLYTGNFRLFPADAAGRRVLALSDALKRAGHSVCLIPRLGYRQSHIVEYDTCVDFDYILDNGTKFSWARLIREAYSTSYSAIIAYNPSNLLALLVRLISSLRGTNAVLDLTEWYEYAHLPSFRSKAEVFLRMNATYRLFSRMIFISEYLASCYRPAIGRIIPPLVSATPLKAPRHTFDRNGPLKILYAGFPGQKDRIDRLILWLEQVELPFPVQLILAGPRPDQINAVGSNGFEIVSLGPVHRQKVFELYQECHLSAIIRDDARYEWAGFPTKSVESWSFGVPILVMSHSRFAKSALQYGAAVAIDEVDPVASLENTLKRIYFDEGCLAQLSESALRLTQERHLVTNYVSTMEEIVS